MPALKYQLPSSPAVYVDVVDDEDVALMIDEWREAVAGGASNLRLHIFVQVKHLPADGITARKNNRLDIACASESIHTNRNHSHFCGLKPASYDCVHAEVMTSIPMRSGAPLEAS